MHARPQAHGPTVLPSIGQAAENNAQLLAISICREHAGIAVEQKPKLIACHRRAWAAPPFFCIDPSNLVRIFRRGRWVRAWRLLSRFAGFLGRRRWISSHSGEAVQGIIPQQLQGPRLDNHIRSGAGVLAFGQWRD